MRVQLMYSLPRPRVKRTSSKLLVGVCGESMIKTVYEAVAFRNLGGISNKYSCVHCGLPLFTGHSMHVLHGHYISCGIDALLTLYWLVVCDLSVDVSADFVLVCS